MGFYIFVRSLGMWVAVLSMAGLFVTAVAVGMTAGEFVAAAGVLTGLVWIYDVVVVRPTRRGRS